MTETGEQSWWKRRWEALLDNAIFWGLGIVGTATVALFVALGLAMGAIAIFGIPS